MGKNKNELFLFQWAFIIILTAAISSLLLYSLIPAGNSNIEKAKELGIVSLTVLSEYSKSRETTLYLFSLFFIVSASFIAGFIFRKKYIFFKADNTFNKIQNAPKTVETIIFLLGAVLLTYYSNFFYSNWLDHYVFYSEEGQHLSYVTNLFHGKDLFSDTYVIYGPLMEYPIYWLMCLFGKKIAVFRLFTYILNLGAYTVLYFILRKLCRYFLTAIAGVLILIVIYFPVFPAPNGSHMRTACGMIPLILFFSDFGRKNKIGFFFAGLAVSSSFFFSPEVGIASSVSILSLLIIDSLSKEKISLTDISHPLYTIASGFFLMTGIVFLFLFIKGNLVEYLTETISYPYYVTLGFGNIPFPDIINSFSNLISNFTKDSLLHFFTIFCFYWPIITYFILISFFILNVFTSEKKDKSFFLLGISIYGIILFRGALSRSGIDRNYLLVQPALILAIYTIEEIVIRFFRNNNLKNKLIYAFSTAYLSAGIIFYGAIPGQLAVKTALKSISSKVLNGNLTVSSPLMAQISTQNSGIISIPPKDAKRIMTIKRFLTPYLDKGEFFFVFPNDAIYYFLFDSPMPTPFGVLHDAATKELKMNIVKSLREEKPRFIINAENIYQVDLIPEEIEFSKIKEYIDNNYYLLQEIYGVKILEDKSFLNDDKFF